MVFDIALGNLIQQGPTEDEFQRETERLRKEACDMLFDYLCEVLPEDSTPTGPVSERSKTLVEIASQNQVAIA